MTAHTSFTQILTSPWAAWRACTENLCNFFNSRLLGFLLLEIFSANCIFSYHLPQHRAQCFAHTGLEMTFNHEWMMNEEGDHTPSPLQGLAWGKGPDWPWPEAHWVMGIMRWMKLGAMVSLFHNHHLASFWLKKCNKHIWILLSLSISSHSYLFKGIKTESWSCPQAKQLHGGGKLSLYFYSMWKGPSVIQRTG